MTDIKKIKELIQEELAEANEIHPQFHSDHEAWAVIKEELEECEEALKYANHHAACSWLKVKKDHEIKDNLIQVKKYAMNLAAEAIQVAAMCEKGLARYERKED